MFSPPVPEPAVTGSFIFNANPCESASISGGSDGTGSGKSITSRDIVSATYAGVPTAAIVAASGAVGEADPDAVAAVAAPAAVLFK